MKNKHWMKHGLYRYLLNLVKNMAMNENVQLILYGLKRSYRLDIELCKNQTIESCITLQNGPDRVFVREELMEIPEGHAKSP